MGPREEARPHNSMYQVRGGKGRGGKGKREEGRSGRREEDSEQQKQRQRGREGERERYSFTPGSGGGLRITEDEPLVSESSLVLISEFHDVCVVQKQRVQVNVHSVLAANIYDETKRCALDQDHGV